MGLKEELYNDYKESMKAHDTVAKDTISLARAAIKQAEIDSQKELDDQGVMGILQKQIKMRKDALADFEKAGRQDLSDAYRKEIAVLEKYIPEQLTAEQIREVVEEMAKKLNIAKGKQNMGKLMGPVMGQLKGRADGNAVREVVTGFLSEE